MNSYITYANLTIRSCHNRLVRSPFNFTCNFLGFPRWRIRPSCIIKSERRLYTFELRRTSNHPFSNMLSNYTTNAVSSTLSAVVCTADAYTPNWTIHQIHLMTCSDMWEERPEGASFNVGYVDTLAGKEHLELRARLPTALVVEGSIGVDMRPLLEELARKGFRVVMPYLVGSYPTKATSVMDRRQFSNLLGERSSFLLDFIGAMNLKSIDVVIGHSFGCLPVLTLAANISLFKSIALVCPIPAHNPPRWYHPAYINNLALRWINKALLRPLASIWIHLRSRGHFPAVLSSAGSVTEQLQLIWEISLGINYDNMYGMFELFKSRRSSVLYVYSEKDTMVNVDDNVVYAHLLGIDQLQHEDLSSARSHSTDAADAQYQKLLGLSSSSHFPPKEKQLCERIVNEIVLLYQSSKNPG